jgi:hypothetical protein
MMFNALVIIFLVFFLVCYGFVSFGQGLDHILGVLVPKNKAHANFLFSILISS